MSYRSSHDVLYHLWAPALLIFTPFVRFLSYNDYSFTAPEILICLGGLAAIAFLCGLAAIVGGWPVRVLLTASLLVLWVDLQFDWLEGPGSLTKLRVIGVFLLALILCFAIRRHLTQIVTAVFATMLLSTVVLAAVDGPASRATGAATADSDTATTTKPTPLARAKLPIFVHLIFDEHIGLEGIPEDVPHGREMRNFLREFFDSYGFRLFARAYSRYPNTASSLPNLVNFTSLPGGGALTSGAEPSVLLTNRYFELLGRAGYKIHVYQPNFIDFCAASRKYIAKCVTSGDIKTIESLDIPVPEKVTLIYRRYADLSLLKDAAGARYTHIRELLRPAGWTLPEWWLKEGRLGPLAQMPLFDVITADVTRASPGSMFFAHLLNPHNPYVYDATCELRPVREWEHSRNPGPLSPNNRESRARRYGLYLEQLRCLYRRLDAMFQAWRRAAIFDQMVLVIHGDHGSRIYQRFPTVKNRHQLSDSDYVDEFSTLFAVKGPRHPPGYDRRVAPIQQLLGDVVGEPIGDADKRPEPWVFLPNGPAKPLRPQPFAAFADER